MIFLLIVIGLPLLNVLWWFWADTRLRRVRTGKAWRAALAAFVGLSLALYAWLLLARLAGVPLRMPMPVLAGAFIWHLVVLPLTTLCLAGGGLVWLLLAGAKYAGRLVRPVRWSPGQTAPAANAAIPPDCPQDVHPTRREVLAAAAVALPPLATAVAELRGLTQLDDFRVRRLNVALPALPQALDGLTIAHVSDVHVGRFTRGQILKDVAERTNALRPDLVLFTGDLIDHALADLPVGLDLLRRLQPRAGLFLCEGNHDLFEDRAGFEDGVRAAGVPLLLNEAALLTLRGQRVQLLGLRWGHPGGPYGPHLGENMRRALALRDPRAFTILLAHHPHAFDYAAAAGIPLTLSGHTHGGQLMLTRHVGAGALLFRYISGLYRKNGAALVVSNGVGNWLPLRVNAPAEIILLTLKAPARTG